MRFFAIAAALAAVATAQYAAEETCESVVTVTVTQTLKHTPSAPSAHVPTVAPYPTTAIAHPSKPVGTGYPLTPEASSKAPVGTGSKPSSTKPATPEFTGAASGLKVGGVLAGAGAVAALFL